jgi:hypothetical protein
MEDVVTEFVKGRRGKFLPGSTDAHELSRTKVELFLRCQRCFWLDRRLGIAPPGPPPYSLNASVDELLKREILSCCSPSRAFAQEAGVVRPVAKKYDHGEGTSPSHKSYYLWINR